MLAHNQKGMTLIEIMITMAIIGAMMALGAAVLFPGNDARAREEAVRLAGMIKYLYDESVVKHKYFRIAFNLDEKTYKVESSSESFLVQMEGDDAAKKPPPAPGSKPAPEPSPPAGENFVEEADDSLTRERTFPQGIKFKDIQVMHAKDPQQSGIVYAYIFPNGWIEPMVINVSDDDEEVFYSLEINPLTGKAKIRNEYYQAKEEDIRPGAAQ